MKRIRHRALRTRFPLVAALVAAAVAPLAPAQEYPVKPVRIVVPFAPGGSVDLNVRLFAGKFGELLGQQIVVDNRSGASGNIGTEMVARSSPDGYTLLLHTVPFVTSPILYSRVPYDVVNDFAPVSLVSTVPMAVAVHPSVPVRSVKELLALAKGKPGALNYGSSGIGSNSHITGELFNYLGKTNIMAVQFKGGGPALLAVVSGECHVSFSNVAETSRMVAAGRLRALGVSSLKRVAVLPDVPPIAESGLPGFEFEAWHGLLAPRATPAPLVAQINQKFRAAMSAPDQVKRFEDRGLEPVTSSPEEFAAYLKKEVAKWGKVIRERNMKAE